MSINPKQIEYDMEKQLLVSILNETRNFMLDFYLHCEASLKLTKNINLKD